jgi:hypothetical protein
MNRPGNSLGLGLVVVGAFAMALAAFLPLDEPTAAFRMVEDNTLIQRGGWVLIVAAIGIAAGGFRANQHPRGNALAFTVVGCVVTAFGIVGWATNDGLRTLYPVGANGAPDTSKAGEVVPLGIALYVAGAGVAAALVGLLMLRQTEKSAASDPFVAAWEAAKTTKKCPDCAETILVDAKVCKHCKYRFTAGAPTAPQTQSPEQNVKAKCHKCQHVQVVPVSQSTIVCEKCNTKLTKIYLN